MVLRLLGMAAWHTNGNTRPKKRQDILEQFSGALQKPVHVLVTVEVLGEGASTHTHNADTCMFVEPLGSYLRRAGHGSRAPAPAKPLAHINLPAVALLPQFEL